MTIQDIIQLIVNNGMGAVLMAYFLYKDWKQTGTIVAVLAEIKEVLVELRTYHKQEVVGRDV